ncbi:heat shock protein Hsp20 [Kalymmatonema gypsitolerans NIES-4073]|nr:heat shock protein Hsp20 [Scytonema sp. NIES-4073]
MRRSEFRYGRFQRVIPLPSRIQNDKVQAEFNNGVLCLMPKAEEERNRVVSINLGGQSNQAISGQQNGQTEQNQAQNQAQTTPQAS